MTEIVQDTPIYEIYDPKRVGELQDKPIRPRFLDVATMTSPESARRFIYDHRNIRADVDAYNGVPDQLLGVDDIAQGDTATALQMLRAQSRALWEKLGQSIHDGSYFYAQTDEAEAQTSAIKATLTMLEKHPDETTFDLDQMCDESRSIVDRLVERYNDDARDRSRQDSMALRGTGTAWHSDKEIEVAQNRREGRLGRVLRRLARHPEN